MFFIVLLLIELSVAASSDVFPEEPAGGEGTVFVPVNSTTTFRCSVAVGYTVSWQVRRLGAQSSVPITVSTAQFELTISNRSSTLTVHGITEELNQAHVLCVATEEDNFLSTEQRGVLVIIYGPPPSPTQLVANTSTNMIDISWSFMSIPAEVPVNFSLMISTPESIRAVVVLEDNYVFDAGNGRPRCTPDTYLIRVVAVNPAGSSLPAEVSVTLPPLPDISQVNMVSLEYSLSRGVQLQGRIQLTVTLENINPCPDFPVVYNLVLEDFEGNRTSYAPDFSDGQISIFLVVLTEDTVFRFYTEATTQLGTCTVTMPKEIVTTDVQNVSLCQLNDTTFLITCTYLSGSTARGCVYTLVSEGMKNLTGRIERGSSSEITADLEQYYKVILFDWESDGTNGTTPIRTNLSFTSCPTATIAPPSLNIAAVVIPVVLVVVITVVIVVIVICGVMKRRVKGSSDKGQSTAMSTRREAESDAMYDTIQEAQIDNKESVQCEDNPAYGTATNGSSAAT